MQEKIILETTRLTLREFTIHDAHFILELLNTPNWLEFIGDKNVKNLEDARNYIKNSLIVSYQNNGFGLWLVALKETKTPIGMCGLVDRETLDDIDIGYALLPKYVRLGYAYEIANATMNYARYHLGINTIIAITDAKNKASIAVLEKIGLSFERTLTLSKNDSVLVFTPSKYLQDQKDIEEITTSFFDLFTNTAGNIPNVEKITELFISDGILINNTKTSQEIYSLDTFVTPRKQILNDGTLTNFCESEISSKTKIFKNIAQRWSLYEKSGNYNGVYFETKGVKIMQFIKKNDTWKLTSVVWNDEE
ncbi:GNAT family N-acetyltransferase [Kordia sp.]|uniref:GNAT family N-acetyltransferase n=1 Tax=Kordia sp. TaxID=1965332 RepID=UPI003B592330